MTPDSGVMGGTIRPVRGGFQARLYVRLCPGKWIADEQPVLPTWDAAHEWLIREAQRIEQPKEESDYGY